MAGSWWAGTIYLSGIYPESIRKLLACWPGPGWPGELGWSRLVWPGLAGCETTSKHLKNIQIEMSLLHTKPILLMIVDTLGAFQAIPQSMKYQQKPIKYETEPEYISKPKC